MTNQDIEQEIQAKGKTAPRVTPQSIEDAIGGEHAFNLGVALAALQHPVHESVKLVNVHVLIMKNGFAVVGKSACASPENYDFDIGRKVARQDAVNQLWPLMGYALRDQIATLANLKPAPRTP